MVASERYSTCFIAYGEPDKSFTEELVLRLEDFGVKCWVYSLDATLGERTWREIGKQRREAEKMIVLCSLNSLIRPGLKRELEEQITEDEDKII